jgi:outer membrane lipoprotein-sorting protein
MSEVKIVKDVKKIFVLVVLLLTVNGCTSHDFDIYYENMKSSNSGINGYSMNLRIYGNYDNIRINEIIRISDYKDLEYKITKLDLPKRDEAGKYNNDEIRNDKVIYIVNGKTYVALEGKKYSVANEDVKYNNPSLYIEGLKNISDVKEKTSEKINNQTYIVYSVTFNKDFIYELVDDINVDAVKIKNDVTGKIYVTEENYLDRIIYNIDNVTIDAYYYEIDKSSSIAFPFEVEENGGK